MEKKTVYVSFSADVLHEGHINILKIAKKYGKVIVGLLTDEAVASYKKFPVLNYQQRKIIIKNIKYVSKVIPQNTLDYVPNLKMLKPNYVIHGDDWKKGIQKKTRDRVIKTLSKWSGKLIEPKYTNNISSTLLKTKINKFVNTPENRVSRLKRLIETKKIVRTLEAHNALTGIIIENLNLIKNNEFREFDCMWSSSLTDSLTRGKPDNQSVDYSTRVSGLNEILDVTTKPIIFDADNGGRMEHISFLVKTLERVGVSAIVFEDKVGEKKNSLFSNQEKVKQDSVKNFCKKLKKASNSRVSEDLFIVARIESFILGKGLNDAIKRAEAYSRSGADAILIHSKEKTPKEIFAFSKVFRKSRYYKPLVCVPSTYSKTSEDLLIKNEFKIVIYANQLLRAAYPSMQNVAKNILLNKKAFNVEKSITPIKKIISLIKE